MIYVTYDIFMECLMVEITEIDMTFVDGSASDFKKGSIPALDGLVTDLESKLANPGDFPGKKIPLVELTGGFFSGENLIHNIISDDFAAPPRGLYFTGNIDGKGFTVGIPYSDDSYCFFGIEDEVN